MTQALSLGPFTLPVALLLPLAALVLAGFAGQFVARRMGIDAEPPLFSIVLAGLFAARLAFVAQFHDAYLQAPLSVFDIRDGGLSPLAGIAVAAAAALALGLRRAPLRKPLAAAFGAAGVIWMAGSFVLGALSDAAVRMPALRLQGLDGESVALADFHGRPTVVNLWATWCPPCRREMPVLQEAQTARPDVNFVFVNQGESAGKVRSFLTGQKMPLRNVLLDSHGQVGAQVGHRALPTTLFFDANGRLTDTRIGELSRATLAQRLGAPSSQPGARSAVTP